MNFCSRSCVITLRANKHHKSSRIWSFTINLCICWTSRFKIYKDLYSCPPDLWPDHVTRVVAKANSAPGFLQHNLKYCPPEIKASCFKSLVIPILECGCTSWFPHFQKDTYAIEMVQWRAARFIFNDYSYNTSVTSLLNTLN